MLDIAGRREIFWDGYVLEPSLTDADVRLHEPIRQEAVLVHPTVVVALAEVADAGVSENTDNNILRPCPAGHLLNCDRHRAR